MKKLSSIIFCASLCLVGCTRYCHYHIPDDMASFVPDLYGKTFVYANSSGDSLIMNGGEHFVLQDEELDYEGLCSKCDQSCDFAYVQQGFHCYGDGISDDARASITVVESNDYDIKFYSNLQGGIDVHLYNMHATFDGQEHFVTRDFGDTLILTGEPNRWDSTHDNDTVILVRNIGVIRVNDYKLIDIRD